jgi:hypothetical protein
MRTRSLSGERSSGAHLEEYQFNVEVDFKEIPTLLLQLRTEARESE